MQNLEPSRSTWTRTSRNRSHAWKYLRNLVFCIWQPAISMLQECLSNCHPGVTIQGPKPQPTSSFVPANHFATLWNDYAYFPAHSGIEMDVHHVPGHANQEADDLSRMDVETECPNGFTLSDRIRMPLSDLWMDRPSPSLIPNDTKIPWRLPNS